MDIDWIFFDCFNTLIDDFDESGEESGLGTLPKLSIELGCFEKVEQFLESYHAVQFPDLEEGAEVTLQNRLIQTLQAGALSASEIPWASAALMERWQLEYPRSLRATPGVAEMLSHWKDKCRMGVVSNFFIPDLPASYLNSFGLDSYFEFVLDSARYGYKKPHERVFMEALKLAKLSPQQANRVLFIGDRLDLDIHPSKELGMNVIHFNRSRIRPSVTSAQGEIKTIYDWSEFR